MTNSRKFPKHTDRHTHTPQQAKLVDNHRRHTRIRMYTCSTRGTDLNFLNCRAKKENLTELQEKAKLCANTVTGTGLGSCTFPAEGEQSVCRHMLSPIYWPAKQYAFYTLIPWTKGILILARSLKCALGDA